MTERLIRYSATSTFLESRLLYCRKYIENLERIYGNELRPMQAYDVGNIGHAGLAAYYKGRRLDVCRRAMRFKAHSQKTYDTDKVTKEHGYSAFERYITWSQEYQPDRKYEIVDVEKRLYIDLGEIRGDHVILTFEPDLVVRNQFGLMEIFDHKFVDKYTSLASFVGANRQGFTYALGCQEVYGETVYKFTLNQIRRSVPKKPTTPFMPVDRISQQIKQHSIEQHRVYLRRIVTDMVQLHQEVEAGDYSGAYPNPTYNCANMCNIFDICCNAIAQDPAVLADTIATRFRTKDTTL